MHQTRIGKLLDLARSNAAAGFTDAAVTFTHEAVPGMHGAIVHAVKPAGSPA